MNSLLFVPALEKMLNKLPGFHADAYIIDLEDSIPAEKKQSALEILISFLDNKLFENRTIFVRLNESRLETELKALSCFPIAGYMIPKFEDPKQYPLLTELLLGKKVIALVETPRGVLHAEQIAAAEWVSALAFGAEDYTAAIGMENRKELLLPVRSRLIACARAYGKRIYDTPSFILESGDALTSDVHHAVELGFDGKLAIHPRQVDTINDLFQQFDAEYLRSVIERYEARLDAVQIIDGRVYEKMHIAHYKKILKERCQ